MVGTGIHLYKRNIPMSLKVIHARMVAQGGVIAALCGVGAYSLYNEFSGEHKAGSASVRAMVGMGGGGVYSPLCVASGSTAITWA